MAWGTYYKFEGYLSRISKSQLENKLEECQRINDMLWREILAYMAATPPATAKDCEGEEYPYPEYLAMKIRELREEIEENATLMARINDCLEAMRENP
ncbi:MAG: hypothetical protein IKA47_06620, partial [Oscillospiraceae bacterium]|nr:hypothetical protein [Oscillospiraceae bacterium]